MIRQTTIVIGLFWVLSSTAFAAWTCSGEINTPFGAVPIQLAVAEDKTISGTIEGKAVSGDAYDIEEFTRWKMHLGEIDHLCELNDWTDMNKAHCTVLTGHKKGTTYIMKCKL